MTQRTLRKRIALLLATVLLSGQLAIAAHACPGGPAHPAVAAGDPAAAAMPDCDDAINAAEAAASNLCAEHCKQGQQSDRTSPAVVVPPALASALYQMVLAPAPVRCRQPRGAWLSALVATSPPHAIAHCVLRI